MQTQLEQNKMREVTPLSPPTGYFGGKRILSKTIIPLIEAIPHSIYGEVFMGMGGIFFRRRLAPPSENINDLSGEVANFFRILQRHYVPFVELLRYQVTSRKEFERLKSTPPETLTDLERAARFLYMLKLSFASKVAGQNFGVDATRSGRFDITRIQPILEEVHERLSGVTIENLNYLDFLKRYDKPETLFYLDPPYWGCEDDYGKNLFSRDDFDKMAQALWGLKGKFILSLNDTPEVRNIFDGFHRIEVEVTYSVAANTTARKGFPELLISNVPLDKLSVKKA